MTPREPAWTVEDSILMERLARDDHQALRTLVERHEALLMNFFMRSGAESHAEDLVQETFVRLYGYRKQYRPLAKFTTFLHTLARHVWIDHVRKRGRWLRLLKVWSENAQQQDDHSAGRASRQLDAKHLLAGLSSEMREVVVLVFYQGLSHQEVAEVLGIPTGTVKSRLFNALKRMKETMTRDERDSAHDASI